jgi:hypothetical protein
MARNFDDILANIHFGNQEGKTFLNDAEAVLEVDTLTREIIVPTGFNTDIAVTTDYNSNEIRFALPLQIDGHDILECQEKVVKWHNKASDERGWSTLIMEDENSSSTTEEGIEKTYRIMKWIIPAEATTAAGVLEFALCFCDSVEEAGRDSIVYKWNSKVCSKLKVAQGLDSVSIKGTAPSRIITLDLYNRTMKLPSEFNTTIGYVGDYGVNKLTFRLDRFFNGHDFLDNSIAMQYQTSSGVLVTDYALPEMHRIEALEGNPYDDLLEFDWTLPANLMANEGPVTIVVTIFKTTEDGYIYSWNSKPESRFSIGPGYVLSGFEQSTEQEGLLLVDTNDFTDLLSNYFDFN